ncbi:CIC11C00000003566 [Sungouiella intermedia]|uniref:Cytidine deaminase n=1 Tax=Sungouiella intermedia TaxID=45354 RepID=A0A1L0D1A4_9ASCO|nr:CIC11C00000003566 [[Candida] intermedia]
MSELTEVQISLLKEEALRVGAAVLTVDGHVITGANVENALYGGAICAERTAIVRSVALGHRKFQAIAISSDQEAPISPCGICRQVIREFFDLGAPVYMYSSSGDKCIVRTLEELLPLSFGPENLGQ